MILKKHVYTVVYECFMDAYGKNHMWRPIEPSYMAYVNHYKTRCIYGYEHGPKGDVHQPIYADEYPLGTRVRTISMFEVMDQNEPTTVFGDDT